MKAWKENDKIAFDFHNAHEINNLRDGSSEEQIKKKLRERLNNTKVLIILIGEKTKDLYKYVRWEIDWAIENNIPIIAVNINKKKSIDIKLCPPLLNEKLAMHIAFGQKIMNFSLNNWPSQHTTEKKNGKSGAFYYRDEIYSNL
jgi:sugar-specific transcriptional regulator TrmB